MDKNELFKFQMHLSALKAIALEYSFTAAEPPFTTECWVTLSGPERRNQEE